MEINKVCVVGAGAMGSGIAQLIAFSGYSVNLVDINEELLITVKEKIDHKIIYFYVLDDTEKLIGIVPVRKLLLSDYKLKISDRNKKFEKLVRCRMEIRRCC